MRERKRRRDNRYTETNKTYWNLSGLNDSISSIIDKLISAKIINKEDIKRCPNGKSYLTLLQEKLSEKSEKTHQLNEFQKQKIKEIIEDINLLQVGVYYIVEHLLLMLKPYIIEIEEIDPSGILVDKIKEKMKAAVERYNGKWTTFEKRIKTDIRREIEKVRKNKIYNYSSFLNDNFDDARSIESREYKRDSLKCDWNFMTDYSPEDYLMAREAALGIFSILN